jgi:hypothetical protein
MHRSSHLQSVSNLWSSLQVVFDGCMGLSRLFPILCAVEGIERCLVFGHFNSLGFDDMPDQPPSLLGDLKTCILETPWTFDSGNLVKSILLRAPHMQSFAFSYTNLPYETPSRKLLSGLIVQSLSAMRLRSLTLFGPRKMGIDR